MEACTAVLSAFISCYSDFSWGIKLSINRLELISRLEKAFEGVQLSNGIGIYEAESIDNHDSISERKKSREKDIRDDWKTIRDDVIDEYYYALTFMDYDGLHFAIPAYMRYMLNNYDTNSSAAFESLIGILLKPIDWNFLTDQQKQVIASCLQFIVLEAEGHVDTFQASLAYENYWAEFAIE